MSKVAVDLDLSSKLEDDVVLDDLFLCDDLDGHEDFSDPVPGQIHMPVLALAQMTTDLKVLYAPIQRVEDLSLGFGEQVARSVVEDLFLHCEAVDFADVHELLGWRVGPGGRGG